MAEQRGKCGEIVSHVDSVERKRVSEENAERTWIKWLFRGEDGALTFAMRVFEVEPGGFIKPHYHPWEHGIYVLEGRGEVRVGSRVYRVSPGTYMYIPPNVEHEYVVHGNEPMKFICVVPLRPSATESRRAEC